MSTDQFLGVGAEQSYDSRRLSGVCLFVLAAYFMTVVMLASAMAPGYDFGGGAISDLGVIDATATLFNGSLVLVGVLNGVGGYLLFRSHGDRRILTAFGLASVGAVGAGVFTLDASGLHSLFALLAFLFFNVEAIVSARLVEGPMKAISVFAGTVGLVFVVLMAIGDAGNATAFGPIGHGGTERMIVYPPMTWLMAFGGYLMATPRHGGGTTAEASG